MNEFFINLPDADLAYFPEAHRALRRLRGGGGVGAGLCALEPRS